MLLASIFTGIICLYLNTWYTGKTLNYTFVNQLKDIAPSYFTAFVIATAVYFLKYLPVSYWLVLLLQITIGIIVGFIISELLKLEEYKEIKKILGSLKNK